MKYCDFRDCIMQLINSYSSNGVVLDNLYNDQSDYVIRIPALYNSACTKIATNGKGYRGVIDKESTVVEGGHHHHDHHRGYENRSMVLIKLPEDFIKVDDNILDSQGDRVYRSNIFHEVGDDKAYVDKELLHGGALLYDRWPRKLSMEPGADIDGVELDGDREQQDAASYYVAAMLVYRDDAYAASVLMNEFEDRLSNMFTRLRAETNMIRDVYTIGMYVPADGGCYL